MYDFMSGDCIASLMCKSFGAKVDGISSHFLFLSALILFDNLIIALKISHPGFEIV